MKRRNPVAKYAGRVNRGGFHSSARGRDVPEVSLTRDEYAAILEDLKDDRAQLQGIPFEHAFLDYSARLWYRHFSLYVGGYYRPTVGRNACTYFSDIESRMIDVR